MEAGWQRIATFQWTASFALVFKSVSLPIDRRVESEAHENQAA